MYTFSKYAIIFTMVGFGYLIIVLALVAFQLWAYGDVQTITQYCGQDPELFGIKKTDVWLCSKFSEIDLAEKCVNNPPIFNKSFSVTSLFLHLIFRSDLINGYE